MIKNNLTDLELVQLCFFPNRTNQEAVEKAADCFREEQKNARRRFGGGRLTVAEITSPMRCIGSERYLVGTRHLQSATRVHTDPVYWPSGRVARDPRDQSPYKAEAAANAALDAVAMAHGLFRKLEEILGDPVNESQEGRTNVFFVMVPSKREPTPTLHKAFAGELRRVLFCEELSHVDSDVGSDIGFSKCVTMWRVGPYLIVLFDGQPASCETAQQIRDALLDGKIDEIECLRHDALPRIDEYELAHPHLGKASNRMPKMLTQFLEKPRYAKEALKSYLALSKAITAARREQHGLEEAMRYLKIGKAPFPRFFDGAAILKRCETAKVQMERDLEYVNFVFQQATAMATQMSDAVKARTARRYAIGFGLFAVVTAAVTLIQFFSGWNDEMWEKLFEAARNAQALSALGLFAALCFAVVFVFGYTVALIFHRD